VSEAIPAIKDAIGRKPVPTAWRATLAMIAARLVEGDRRLSLADPAVADIDEGLARHIAGEVAINGSTGQLPDVTWDTAFCQWQLGHWDVQVPLSGGIVWSGLSFLVRVRPDANAPGGYRFNVDGVL
jgi:hypothetical protein